MAVVLELDSGLPLNYVLELKDQTIDLNGASSITMMIREDPSNPTILAELSNTNGRIIILSDPWKFRIFLEEAATVPLSAFNTTTFDIVVRFPDETINPPLVIGRGGRIRYNLLNTR